MKTEFSNRMKEVFNYVREEVLRLGDKSVGIEHLFLGILREGEGTAIRVLKELSIDPKDLRVIIESNIPRKNNERNIDKESIDNFLLDKVSGENFNRFIVIKDSRKGPTLSWVKVGVSDLYNVEIVQGLDEGDVVYILPSKSLFDYQERFKERVSGTFSFG